MSFFFNIENPEEKENYNFINTEKNIIKPNQKINNSFYNVPQSNSQFQIIIPVESNSSKMDICSDNNESSNNSVKINSIKNEKEKTNNNIKNKENKLCEELDKLDITDSSLILKNQNKKKDELIHDFKSLQNFYINKESEKNLLNYGETYYSFSKELNNICQIPDNFLKKHNINSYTRTRMVDWMMECLGVFKKSNETIFLSVYIMDQYLNNTKTILKNENIHLIGIASMSLATKYEDIIPIYMFQFIEKIGHYSYSSKKITHQEKNILKDMNFENFIFTSIYDFIQTFFFDFKYNNQPSLESEESINIYENIKNTAIYLSKICLHFEQFYIASNVVKAVCCIKGAIKFYFKNCKDNSNKLSEELYNDWIKFLIKVNNFDNKIINNLCDDIIYAYFYYQNYNGINYNLNKFNKLDYLKPGLKFNDFKE